MKSMFTFVIGMVYLMSGHTGMAQQPSVGDSISGAVVNETAAIKPAKGLASNGGFVGGIVYADMIPILGKPLTPGGWLEHIVFEQDWKAGFTNWVPRIEKPVLWKDLIYAESGGIATSTNPVVQVLLDLRSAAGNAISIDMISVQSIETPTGLLSDVYSVGSRSYSPAAIGIKEDGTRVTGGSPDQMVSNIVMVVQMKLFNGGGTPAGRQDVRDHVLRQPFYMVAYKVTITDREVVGGKAFITVQGPHLSINAWSVLLEGDGSEYPYDLQFAERAEGPWRVLTTVYSDTPTSISTTRPMMLYRAIPRR